MAHGKSLRDRVPPPPPTYFKEMPPSRRGRRTSITEQIERATQAAHRAMKRRAKESRHIKNLLHVDQPTKKAAPPP